MSRFRSIGFVLILWCASLCDGANCTAAEPAARPITGALNLLDSSGNVHCLTPQSAVSARAFVFLSGDCPISKSYVPTLNRLAAEWKTSGNVSLFGIWSDATTPPQDVASFVKEFEISFPVLLDRSQSLAKVLSPSHVPHAFVLDAAGRLAYSGRIDDVYPEIGKRRPAPTERNLADAVADVVAGRAVAKPRTTPVGCIYESLPTDLKPKVTYARDIAPIVFANCAGCHREGEVAPFSLTTYEGVAKRTQQILQVVDKRLMPPWMPAETHGEFEGQRSLTADELELLRAWVSGGSPEGDAKELPPLPTSPSGWRLGKPDLVLEMESEFELGAEGGDLFQNFIIPLDVPEDKFVAAIDFVPGNPKIVHHALLFLDSTGAARRKDAKTPEPGYSSFGGPGFQPTGSLGGWSPGKTPRKLAGGLGRYLQKGSDVVLQVHYYRSGKVEKDRSKVAVYFVDKPTNVAADIWVAAYHHDIPPGKADYKLAASYVLPQELQMLGVVPHMHLIGKSVAAVANLPDGTTRKLVEIPRWNFNWQDDYRFATPFRLPKGTKIEVEATYDNSADNPANPNSPPARVRWGEETTDEMLYCFFLVAVDNPKENLRPLMVDMLAREAVGQATGRRLLRFGQ